MGNWGTSIENLNFENVEIHGRKILSAADAELKLLPRSTRNIVFR